MYSMYLDAENVKVYCSSFHEELHEQNFMIVKYNIERLPPPKIMKRIYKFPPKFVNHLKIVNVYMFFDGTFNEFVRFVPRLGRYFSLFMILDVYICNLEFMEIVMKSFDAKRYVYISDVYQPNKRTTLSKVPFVIKYTMKVHNKIRDNLHVYCS